MGAAMYSVLCCLLLLVVAKGDVYVLTTSYNLEPFPDLPADFGPEVPDVGIEGVLRSADPEDACQPFNFSDFDSPWVALISRQQQFRSLNCTFDIKVRNAQDAGAIAVIVYDDVYESLIIMSKPHGHLDPDIPSVFVTQKAGIIMKKLMDLDQIHVRITPVSTIAWISMVMSAFLGLLALTVVFASFYIMRTWSLWLGNNGRPSIPGQPGQATQARSHVHEGGLSPSALRALPVLVFDAAACRIPSLPGSLSNTYSLGQLHEMMNRAMDDPEQGDMDEELADSSGKPSSSNSSECELPLPPGVHAGETKRVCTICLENYVEGEKVRVLPCHHRFHMSCIDQWLSSRRLCPVCKHDASRPLVLAQPPPAATAASGGNGAAAGTGNWWRRTFSAQRRSVARARMLGWLSLAWQRQQSPDQQGLTQPLLQANHDEQAATGAAGAERAAAAGARANGGRGSTDEPQLVSSRMGVNAGAAAVGDDAGAGADESIASTSTAPTRGRRASGHAAESYGQNGGAAASSGSVAIQIQQVPVNSASRAVGGAGAGEAPPSADSSVSEISIHVNDDADEASTSAGPDGGHGSEGQFAAGRFRGGRRAGRGARRAHMSRGSV